MTSDLKLEAFANKKLGLGVDTQEAKNIKRNNAESKALSILRAVTRNWSLSKSNIGGGGGGGGDDYEKDIGVRLSDLLFPNPGNVPRLDYGQKLKDFKIVVFNKTNKKYNVTMNAFILSGDTKILEISSKSFVLKAKSKEVFPENILEVNKNVFRTAGVYRIRLHLIDNDRNIRLDEITRRVWIETDPELAGPFDVHGRKFSDFHEELNINKSKEWFLSPEGDNKYTLYYNLDHPAYLFNDEPETTLVGYLSEIFLMGALELHIIQSTIKGESDKTTKELPIELDALRSSNPHDGFSECVLALSKLREKIYGMIK